MYKVIGNTNTRTLRVLWAMNEIGLEYEHLKVEAQSAASTISKCIRQSSKLGGKWRKYC